MIPSITREDMKSKKRFWAAPRNSARSLRQVFCPNSKFGKRRNPVWISACQKSPKDSCHSEPMSLAWESPGWEVKRNDSVPKALPSLSHSEPVIKLAWESSGWKVPCIDPHQKNPVDFRTKDGQTSFPDPTQRGDSHGTMPAFRYRAQSAKPTLSAESCALCAVTRFFDRLRQLGSWYASLFRWLKFRFKQCWLLKHHDFAHTQGDFCFFRSDEHNKGHNQTL